MKNMKKVLFAGMTAAMLAAATLPALAESTAVNAPVQGMQQQARGGKGGRGMQNGQRPGMAAPNAQRNGSSGTPFRGDGMNGRRMTPRLNGKAPDAQNPESGNDADEISGATGKRFSGMRGGRGRRNGRGIGTKYLVEQGVIDQETADKIESYFREKKAEGKMDKLVEDGVIDQETADKISAYLESLKPQKPAEGGSPEEAPAEGEVPPGKPEGGDPALAALVEQGVITQEQADAIEAARAAQPDPDAETEI